MYTMMMFCRNIISSVSIYGSRAHGGSYHVVHGFDPFSITAQVIHGAHTRQPAGRREKRCQEDSGTAGALPIRKSHRQVWFVSVVYNLIRLIMRWLHHIITQSRNPIRLEWTPRIWIIKWNDFLQSPRLVQSRSATASFYVMNVDKSHVEKVKTQLNMSDLQANPELT